MISNLTAPVGVTSTTRTPARPLEPREKIAALSRPGVPLAPVAVPYQHDYTKEAAELVVAQQEIDSIRGFFRALGVQDSEGNGPARILIDDSVDNAAYSRVYDAVLVGKFPLSQIDPSKSDVSYTQAPDVLAHEWTHRIVYHLVPGIAQEGEDAAINESLADTFACAFDAKDWTIAEGTGLTMRTLDDPNGDRVEKPGGHPGSVADVQRMFQQSAYFRKDGTPEPHALSGVPSKAASIIGDRLGRDTMAKIYLRAVRDYLQPGKNITGLAYDTMRSAVDLFGAQSNEAATVAQAWDAVGILDVLKAHPNATPSIVAQGDFSSWSHSWLPVSQQPA